MKPHILRLLVTKNLLTVDGAEAGFGVIDPIRLALCSQHGNKMFPTWE